MNPRLALVTIRDDRADVARCHLRPEQMRQALLRDPTVADLDADVFQGTIDAPGDVVRARSNAAAMVLRDRPDVTHILWWDDDVLPASLATVGRLVRSGHDVVGCPVPMKRIARWDQGEPCACDYPYRVAGADQKTEIRTADAHGCIEVDALPFGLMLTSTAALRRMVEHYAGRLTYRHEGKPIVALFQLLLTPEVIGPDGQPWRELLSEDYSFCRRWRQIGGTVHMLLDACSHVGGHVFKGDVRGLAHCR